MKIVFFGTPAFASYILKEIDLKFNVICVVTNPDRKSGRGKLLTASHVKQTALESNIDFLQPTDLTESTFINKLKDLKADLFFVVAFKKLPKCIWEIPSKGTVNLHTSYLPNYRGAAPINWVLINGELETGVTTFMINDKIDQGDIIVQQKVPIDKNTTAGQLHNILKTKGAKESIKSIELIQDLSIRTHKQNIVDKYSAAPKLEKKNFRIDWSKSAMSIHNLIRGLSPYIEKDLFLKDISICPCAWFVLKMKDKEKRVKLYLTELISKDTRINEITTDNKSYLHFNLNDYSLSIIYLQIEGKGIMNIKSFLSGYKFNNDWKFL